MELDGPDLDAFKSAALAQLPARGIGEIAALDPNHFDKALLSLSWLEVLTSCDVSRLFRWFDWIFPGRLIQAINPTFGDKDAWISEFLSYTSIVILTLNKLT